MLKQFKATAVTNFFWLSENEKSTLSFKRLKRVHGYDKKELLKKALMWSTRGGVPNQTRLFLTIIKNILWYLPSEWRFWTIRAPSGWRSLFGNNKQHLYLTVKIKIMCATIKILVSSWQRNSNSSYFQLGVVFFKSDGIIPLAHAIWHIHVVFGALIHYNAVRKYLITPENQLWGVVATLEKSETADICVIPIPNRIATWFHILWISIVESEMAAWNNSLHSFVELSIFYTFVKSLSQLLRFPPLEKEILHLETLF